jgi:hypothetical protein
MVWLPMLATVRERNGLVGGITVQIARERTPVQFEPEPPVEATGAHHLRSETRTPWAI